MRRLFPAMVGVLAVASIVLAAERLINARGSVATLDILVGETPATVYRPADERFVSDPPPAVVIAHGFAGSRTLMEPFAIALARNGYLAVTFDFIGHGEHPGAMAGDVNSVDGPTQAMVRQMGDVAADALSRTGGLDLAVLGHSMASDIVVRFAKGEPSVDATIAVSMFSPAVTATEPKNLLVIVGDWEGLLKQEALRAVGLATAPEPAVAGTTTGDFASGTARRAAFSKQSEHIAVLFDTESLEEAVRWLDQSFGVDRDTPIIVSSRLPWIGLLVLGILALAYPLARLLPKLATPPAGAGLGWRRLWLVVLVPAVAVPLTLRVVPTDLLPIVVGDYLAIHFLAYGLLTAALMAWAQRGNCALRGAQTTRASILPLALATWR